MTWHGEFFFCSLLGFHFLACTNIFLVSSCNGGSPVTLATHSNEQLRPLLEGFDVLRVGHKDVELVKELAEGGCGDSGSSMAITAVQVSSKFLIIKTID